MNYCIKFQDRNRNGRRRRRRRNGGQGQQQPMPPMVPRGEEDPNNVGRDNEGLAGRDPNGRNVFVQGRGPARRGRGRVTKYINKYYYIQR